MIVLHVPTKPTAEAIASVVGFVTDGLDAVVIEHAASIEHPGCVRLLVTGNSRDLRIAEERAVRLGKK